MKDNLSRFALSLLALLLTAVAPLSAGAGGEGRLTDAASIEAPAKCDLCGMDRRMFASSRVLLSFADGSSVGTCSVNCARRAAGEKRGEPRRILVADYDTLRLTDARKAHWVIGGDRPAVMSATAKWAFASRKAGAGFVKAHGGRIAGFDAAWRAAEK